MKTYLQFHMQGLVCEIDCDNNADMIIMNRFVNTGVKCSRITLSQYRRLKAQYQQNFNVSLRLESEA